MTTLLFYYISDSSCVISNNSFSWPERPHFSDEFHQPFVNFLFFFFKYSSQKTCCTHPLRRRRGGTRRSVLFRVPTLTLWMWNVQVQFLYTHILSHQTRINTVIWHSLIVIYLVFGFWCIMRCNWCLLCFFYPPRMLQDHDSVQPRSDSRAVCGLFNSPVSAHWRQSTSHRGSVLIHNIHITTF